MPRIAVIGGTGYAGSHIVTEAVRRGHTVVSIARSVPTERIEGATYLEGTVLDVPGLVAQLEGVDVVVSAVAPRGDMEGKLRPAIAELVTALPENVRVGVVGGAGGSLVAEGGLQGRRVDGHIEVAALLRREDERGGERGGRHLGGRPPVVAGHLDRRPGRPARPLPGRHQSSERRDRPRRHHHLGQ